MVKIVEITENFIKRNTPGDSRGVCEEFFYNPDEIEAGARVYTDV